MKLVILGSPRTKKNHQRILRGKGGRSFVAQSAQHDAWSTPAIHQLRAQTSCTKASEPWNREADVNLNAQVFRDRDVGDLLNYLAAISDALEHAGVIKNDRQVVALDGSRLRLDKKNPRVEIDLAPMEET